MSCVCRIFSSGVKHGRDIFLRNTIFLKCLSSSEAHGGSGTQEGSDEKKGCPVCKNADCNACTPHGYDVRKYSSNLPKNARQYEFEPVPDVPSDVFRCATGETIGPMGCANKKGCYKNQEYFSFHNMSYYDLHLVLSTKRLQPQQTNRKP